MLTHNFSMVKRGRKLIACIRCNKQKVHFGRNMCSSCLRQWKRQNKPAFYLGTQYSEIKRRCTTVDLNPTRSYYGKKYCTKAEFINRFVNDPIFLAQYKIWQNSNYKRGNSPSVDRINNSGDYLIDNLQILAHKDNGPKDNSYKVVLYTVEGNKYFRSQKRLAEYLKVSPALICNIIKGKKKNQTGFKFERIES